MQPTRTLLPAFRHACWIKPRLLAFVLLMTLMAPASSSSAGPALFNIELSGDIQANGDVYSVDLSPDASRVVFNGDLEFDGMSELYSTPTRGGERARLSGNHLINGGNVASDFQVAPNRQRAVYRADLKTDNVFELYSFPIRGTDSALTLQLNLPFTLPGSDINGFILSPDSSSLVYTADREIDEHTQIYYAYYAYPAFLPYTSR